MKKRRTRVSQAVIINIGSAIIGKMYSSSPTRKSKTMIKIMKKDGKEKENGKDTEMGQR